MIAKVTDPRETKFDDLKTRVLSSVVRTLASLGDQGFFGTVELKLEAGRIVLLRKTETIKPDDHRGNRDQPNDRDNQ